VSDRRAAGRSSDRPAGEPATKPLPDVGGPGLQILFCGINPSLLSAQRGHHFARPGNRFWPALHGAGFTPRRLTADEDGLLPSLGLGITNIVDRPTRAADELSADELHAGFLALGELVGRWRPVAVAMVGLGGWRTVSGRRRAAGGLQEELVGGRPVWVLPNTSGLNANHQLPELIRRFADLREWVEQAPVRTSLEFPGTSP
jgi:double-stranded uracil-DNA glycosylase